MKFIITCEHAGNNVPVEYRHLFTEADEMLNSHRGYDPGAFDLFNDLKELADFSHFQDTTRLLVESNRSLHHRDLFSKYTKELSPGEKKSILEKYYFPYRNIVENKISEFAEKGEKILHLSIHSFTPELNGEVRNADIGLLYDPSKSGEKEFCAAFKQRLLQHDEKLRVKFNYPYLGVADGFTTHLRKRFSKHYQGIELEVNQNFVSQNKMESAQKKIIFNVLKELLKIEKQENF